MKMPIPSTKPRNPFVAAALRRNAGAHRPGTGAQRQQGPRALRHEIQHLRHSP